MDGISSNTALSTPPRVGLKSFQLLSSISINTLSKILIAELV